MGYSQVRVGVAGMQFYAATQQPSSFVYVYPSRVDELGGFFYYINTAGGWGHASLFEGDGTDYSGPEYAFKNTTLNALYDFLNTPGNWIPGSNKLIVILSNFGTTDGGLFRSKAEVERLLLATNSDTIWGALTDQFDQYRPGTSTYSLNPGKNVALFSGGGRFDAATMLATLRPKIIASAQQRPILFKKQI
jgi:hypothetical protein